MFESVLFYWARKKWFAKCDKHYPSRSGQTSLATAVANFTKPRTSHFFDLCKVELFAPAIIPAILCTCRLKTTILISIWYVWYSWSIIFPIMKVTGVSFEDRDCNIYNFAKTQPLWLHTELTPTALYYMQVYVPRLHVCVSTSKQICR